MDLLTEMVMVLLGLLLVFLAATQRFRPPAGLGLWIGLGAILVLWGGRAWRRGSGYAKPAATAIGRVRGASLVLAGAAMLAMIWMPFGRAQLMLMLVGAILALRGLVCVGLGAGGAWLPGSRPPLSG